VVDGPVIVRSGATLSSSSGDLTIRAKSIVVENGASINVAPTGTSNGPAYFYGGGGGYGDIGTGGGAAASPSYAGQPFGSIGDSAVTKGGRGAFAYSTTAGFGAGGGVLRLIASDSITIAGTVSAIGQNGPSTPNGNYGSGGGAGGGVLVASDAVDITGSISVAGGTGGAAGVYVGGNGGRGRIKVLSGSSRTGAGTLTGVVTQGLLPPLDVGSITHPDPALIYNDNVPAVSFSFPKSFPSRQGYYWRVDSRALKWGVSRD
jgi:hypothetical protein